MVTRIIKKIFNVRDKVCVDKPKSFSTDPSVHRPSSAPRKAVQPQISTPEDLMPQIASVDLSALFYGMLFPSSGTDDGGIANNLEKNVISEVEIALSNPEHIAQKVLKMPSQISELDQKLSDKSVDIDTLLELFKSKPVLSVEILKLCNSPGFKRSEKEVTSLQQAFVQLGSN